MAGLGMENGNIPDSSITASSVYSSYRADQGRLYNQGTYGSWLAGANNYHQWFQVEFGNWTKITRVCTQGRRNAGHWVTKYKLAYGYDSVFYKEYKEEGENAKVRVYCIELKFRRENLVTRGNKFSVFLVPICSPYNLYFLITFADCVTNHRKSCHGRCE